MGLYLSKNIGGGFRVGTRIGGGRRKKDEGGCISAFLFLLTLGLIFTYPKVAIVTGIACVVVLFLYYWAKEGAAAKREKIQELQSLSVKVDKHLDMVNNGKILPARINNADKAIDLLHQIHALDPDQKLSEHNAISLIGDLQSIKVTIPVERHLEKAAKAKFKGSNKMELNALLDALYHCETEGVTDDDFQRSETQTSYSNGIVSLSEIKARAKKLGWEG